MELYTKACLEKEIFTFIYIFKFIPHVSIFTVAQDPCLEGNFRELDHVAKRSPSFHMDSTPLCDRYITEGWYRAKSHVMSTSPPILGKCGTLYPVWLRGISAALTFNALYFKKENI